MYIDIQYRWSLLYSHFQENKTIIRPFVTCGADSWTVTNKIRKSLNDVGKENFGKNVLVTGK